MLHTLPYPEHDGLPLSCVAWPPCNPVILRQCIPFITAANNHAQNIEYYKVFCNTALRTFTFSYPYFTTPFKLKGAVKLE